MTSSLLNEVKTLSERLLNARPQHLSETLPPVSGVYAIFTSSVVESIYVGESSKLRNRLGTHRRGATPGDQMNINLAAIAGFRERVKRQELMKCCLFSWVEVADAPLRLAVEGVLVAHLRQHLNGRVALSDVERHHELVRRQGGIGAT